LIRSDWCRSSSDRSTQSAWILPGSTIKKLRCVVDGHDSFVDIDRPQVWLGNVPGSRLSTDKCQSGAIRGEQPRIQVGIDLTRLNDFHLPDEAPIDRVSTSSEEPREVITTRSGQNGIAVGCELDPGRGRCNAPPHERVAGHSYHSLLIENTSLRRPVPSSQPVPGAILRRSISHMAQPGPFGDSSNCGLMTAECCLFPVDCGVLICVAGPSWCFADSAGHRRSGFSA